VRRSKRLLRGAIAALIEEKPYADIAVREITERADVGYMTFYRHYESKDHLLFAHMRDILEETLAPYYAQSCHEIGFGVFRAVEQNRRLSKIVFLDDNALLVRRLLRDHIANNIQNTPGLLPEREHDVITHEIAATHFAASAINLISWWLNREFPYPVEQMGAIYNQLMLDPMLDAVNTGQPVPAGRPTHT